MGMNKLDLDKLKSSFGVLAEHMFNSFALCEIIWDEKGEAQDFMFHEVNPAFEAMTNLSREQVLGRRVSEAIPGILEVHPELVTTYGQVAKTGQLIKFQFRFSPFGVWYAVSAFCPMPGFFVTLFDDITLQKETQEKIEAAKHQLDSIFEHSGLGLTLIKERRLVQVNRQMTKIFEATKGELENLAMEELIPDPSDQKRLGQESYETLSRGETYKTEVQLKTLKGKIFWARLYSTAIDPQNLEQGSIWNLEDITKERAARAQLAAESNLIQRILEGVEDTIFMFELKDGRAVRWNKAFSQISGYTDAEIASKKAPDDWFDEQDLAHAHEALGAITPGVDTRLVMGLLTKSGEKIPTEYRVKLVSYETGEGHYLLAVGRDLRNRRKAEREIHKKEQLAQQYLDIASVLFVALNATGHIILINKKGCEILGASESEILGHNWFEEFLWAEDRAEIEKVYQQVMGGEGDLVEYYVNPVRTKLGETRLIEWHNAAVYNETGEIVGLFSSGLDITEKRQVEEKLANSEEQLRTLLSASLDGIITIDQNSSVIFWNEGATRILGYDAQEIMGTSLTRILPERFQAGHLAGVARVIREGRSTMMGKPIEMMALTKDQREIPVELSLSQWNLKGKTYFSGILRDISQRKETEAEALRLTQAIDQVEEAVFITDLKGNLIYTNPAFKYCPEVFPQALFASKCLEDQDQRSENPALNKISHTLLDGNAWAGEWVNDADPESPRYFELTISPLGKPSDPQFSLIFIGFETTQRHLQRAKSIQSQKMEALGTLASGVAHEINNPISYVSANVRELGHYLAAYQALVSLYEELEPFAQENKNLLAAIASQKKIMDLEFVKSEVPQMIKDALDGAARIKNIVQNLNEFSHNNSDGQEWVDLNSALQQTLKMVWNEFKHKSLVTENYGVIPNIFGNRQELTQVFLNLLINAGQSIEKQGEINITTRELGDQILIEIKDTGKGIAPKDLPRIFEPFFTTKSVGQGTGLGLSISYGMVKKHGGQIEVSSELGKGTCFTVKFPIAWTESMSQTKETP